MSNNVITQAVAIGVACSIAFMGGYVFRANYGGDRQPVIDAINASQVVSEMFDTFLLAGTNVTIYEELSKIKSLDDIRPLKQKYRDNAIHQIDRFERNANQTKSERKKEMLAPSMEIAKQYRDRLVDKP